jgi:hypothetical protein
MTIFYILILTVLIRGISTLIFLLSSFNFLRLSNEKNKIHHSGKNKIVILIPALREQKSINQTLQYFLRITQKLKNLKIVIITTERENEKSFKGLSTRQLVNLFIKQEKCNQKIANIHYPRRDGYMAHQLNYAIGELKSQKKIDLNTILAIYNADSRPNPSTFSYILNQNNCLKKETVWQQSAIFLKNFKKYSDFKNIFHALFLKTNSLLQTRWTLTHEIPRLLRVSSGDKFLQKYANAHCVGHGLFIKLRTLNKIGGFSEKSVTEDLFIGYLLRAHGIDISPIPYLELADSPENFKASMRQKYVWFWGPMSYLTYFNHFKKYSPRKYLQNKKRAIILMIQGLISGFAWLLSGPIILYILIYPTVITDYHLYWLSIIAIIIYGPAQSMLILSNLKTLSLSSGQNLPKLSTFEKIILSICSVPTSIFNSIPPYFSVIAQIRYTLFGQTIIKSKTNE